MKVEELFVGRVDKYKPTDRNHLDRPVYRQETKKRQHNQEGPPRQETGIKKRVQNHLTEDFIEGLFFTHPLILTTSCMI